MPWPVVIVAAWLLVDVLVVAAIVWLSRRGDGGTSRGPSGHLPRPAGVRRPVAARRRI